MVVEQQELSVLRFPWNDFSSVCSLELDRNCQLDFTAVSDGPTMNSGLLGKVCGCAQPTFESSSNVMTVVLSTDNTNSYRGFSAQYSSVPLPGPVEPNTTLTCSLNSMRIILSKSYLASLGFSEAYLQLNDPSCRPVITDSVIFSFPLASFPNTALSQLLSTALLMPSQLSPSHSSFPRMKATASLTPTPSPWSQLAMASTEHRDPCRMKNNETLEVIYITKNNATQHMAAGGRYNGSMAFYESHQLSKPTQNFPYYVDLNQTLFAEVTLHSPDPNLQVFIDTCTASPQPDFGSLTYDLIRSGCNKDDIVVTYPAFENHGRFKFRAFRFLQSFPSVYLQCDVVICDSNTTSSRCSRGCSSRQKRDISPYTWKTNTVVGSIHLKRDLRAAEYSSKREKINK
ncbi:CUB and zona pellucida-like domain-containing protein 1 [Cyanocitta cristata]